jgi:hypothetical protein
VQIFAQLLACNAASEGLSGEGLACLEGEALPMTRASAVKDEERASMTVCAGASKTSGGRKRFACQSQLLRGEGAMLCFPFIQEGA